MEKVKIFIRNIASKNSFFVFLGCALSIWVPINWFDAKLSEFKYMWGGGGDGLLSFAFIQSLGNGNFPINHQLGYPSGLNWSYYPNGDWTQAIIAVPLNNIFGLGAGVLMMYILSFPLTYLFTHFLFRELNFKPFIAFILSLSITFLPWHFYRLGHVMLGSQYGVAAGLLLIYRTIITNRFYGKKNCAINVCLILFSGLSGVYFAAFNVLLLTVGIVWKFVRTQSFLKVKSDFIILFGLIFSVVAGQAPFRILLEEGIDVSAVSGRQVWESYLYGGRLIYLLMPYPGSGLPFFRRFLSPLRQLPADTESGLPSNFGTFLILVLSILISVHFFVVISKIDKTRLNSKSSEVLSLSYILLFVSMAMFITYGLNLVFAYFVSPQLRAWNRLTPVIQLLITITGAVLLRDMIEKFGPIKKVRHLNLYKNLATVLILFVILLDQVNGIGSMRGLVDQGISRHKMALKYTNQINQLIPRKCPIFQLPVMQFPEVGPINDLADYEPMLPALVDSTRSWSYGSMKNTLAGELNASLIDKKTEFLLSKIESKGFCAIHYDRRGYTNKKIENELKKYLGKPIVIGFDNQWLAFKL